MQKHNSEKLMCLVWDILNLRDPRQKKLMTSLTTCSFAPVSEFRTADLDLGVTNLSDIVKA